MVTRELGRPIAAGRTAEIFEWNNHQVLKLYRDGRPPTWVDYELEIGRIVQEMKLPVPAIGDRVTVQGRHGVIYERIDGVSMLDEFKRKLWSIPHQARVLAQLHLAIHACDAPKDLPSVKNGLTHTIQNAPNLSHDLRRAVLAKLESLPDGNQLCDTPRGLKTSGF